MAGSDAVQRIKERLSIVDVVSPYVELQQAGKNLKGKSPFTNERTPSFYVSPDRGMYYCFSSNQGGDIFTFIQKMEGVEFKEALRILAEKAGVELVPEDPKKRGERDRLYDALEAATKFFEVKRYEHKEAQAYLEDRGVSAESIAKWRIGFAPGPPHFGWRELKAHLEAAGFTNDEMFKAGLIKDAGAGKEPYDLFRDRIMFPIFDQSGKVVAFSGRILSKDSEAPKYVNSPETELFNKSEILYGYDKAKQGIRSLDFALAVEGQFDVVLSHQAGYNNTVAVSGTALTQYHVGLLQRLSNRVVLSLDADRAGIAASKRASELMLPRGIDLKVAHIVGGKDPADLVREDVQKFRKIVGSAKPVIEFFLDILEEQKKDDRNFKLRVREEVLPLVAKIQNRIDQEHFEGVVAERLGTTKDAVHFEVERIQNDSNKKIEQKSSDEFKITGKTQLGISERENKIKNVLLSSTFLDELKKENFIKALAELIEESDDEVKNRYEKEPLNKEIFFFEELLDKKTPSQKNEALVEDLNLLIKFIYKQKRLELINKQKEATLQGDKDLEMVYQMNIDELQKIEKQKLFTIDKLNF